MTALTSIGTLFAFVLVSGGVLLLPKLTGPSRGGFRIPYWNGRYFIPFLYVGFLLLFGSRLKGDLQNIAHDSLEEALFIVFSLLVTGLSIATVIRKYSLIPVLGVLFCAYLLVEIPAIAWKWFFVWMGIGPIIYFLYGYQKSKLSAAANKTS